MNVPGKDAQEGGLAHARRVGITNLHLGDADWGLEAHLSM